MEVGIAERRVEKLFKLVELRGRDDYIGEPVSQIEHACQAAELAISQYPNDIEIILAAFFHDIGHMLPGGQMDNLGRLNHEEVGGEFLRKLGFSDRVVRLVSGHVQAKRYRAFAEPGYYENLSPASKGTLEFQGGIMTAEEAGRFREDPFFELHFTMRGWDEAAKVPNKKLPEMDLFKSMCIAHLASH